MPKRVGLRIRKSLLRKSLYTYDVVHIERIHQQFSTCGPRTTGHWWASDLCLVGRDQGWKLGIF